MFLQNLKKYVRDEVDFLLVDNLQSFIQVDFGITFRHFGHHIFLQDDTIINDGHDQAFSKY